MQLNEAVLSSLHDTQPQDSNLQPIFILSGGWAFAAMSSGQAINYGSLPVDSGQPGSQGQARSSEAGEPLLIERFRAENHMKSAALRLCRFRSFGRLLAQSCCCWVSVVAESCSDR